MGSSEILIKISTYLEKSDNFKERNDLKTLFKNNALLLYALQLRFDIEDIVSVASDALTDGSDDEACDLIYVDREAGLAVVAQAYSKQNPSNTDAAKSHKASDLSNAVGWLFCREISEVPEQIRDSVMELREAIINGEVNSVYFWYLHNCDEKNNTKISDELKTVQVTAQTLLNKFLKDSENEVKVVAMEVGNETIERWYNTSTKRIEIEDKMSVITNGKGFELAEGKWKAYVTAVSGKWLNRLYLKYKEDEIFSGNPRNYLGAGKRKNKINLGIMDTVKTNSDNFWPYNNGITALVNSFELTDKNDLSINGITIINGAQTTGAIGTVPLCDKDKDFWVPSRFIVCNDKTTIEEIVNNNNKQNEILPTDLRSNDRQQQRLRSEFNRYPNLYYNGGRRDAKNPKSREVFDPYLVAQTLTAFHGNAVKAYNNKKDIWDNDKDYNAIFSDQLKAEHIIFVYTLSRAIEQRKIYLKDKKEARTNDENEKYDFLRKRGSKMLLICVTANTLETIIGEKINTLWNLQFINNDSFKKLTDLWMDVIDPIMSFNSYLSPALEGGLKNNDIVTESMNKTISMISAMQKLLRQQMNKFISAIKY
jgi:hypothetical protein